MLFFKSLLRTRDLPTSIVFKPDYFSTNYNKETTTSQKLKDREVPNG